jgi:hypothetical protein
MCSEQGEAVHFLDRKEKAELRIWIRIRFRTHMFLGFRDPSLDPLVRGMDPDPDPDPPIIKQK